MISDVMIPGFLSFRFQLDFLQRIWFWFFLTKFHRRLRRVPVGKCRILYLLRHKCNRQTLQLMSISGRDG